MQESKFDKFTSSLSRSFGYIGSYGGAAAVLIMTLLITVDVLGRFFLGQSTGVANEISYYLLAAVIYLGLVHTQRRGKHIRVTILTDRLSTRKRQLVEMLLVTGTSVFMGWLTCLSIFPVMDSYSGNVTSVTPLNTPLWIPRLLLPVGLGMFTIELTINAVKLIQARFFGRASGEEIQIPSHIAEG